MCLIKIKIRIKNDTIRIPTFFLCSKGACMLLGDIIGVDCVD